MPGFFFPPPPTPFPYPGLPPFYPYPMYPYAPYMTPYLSNSYYPSIPFQARGERVWKGRDSDESIGVREALESAMGKGQFMRLGDDHGWIPLGAALRAVGLHRTPWDVIHSGLSQSARIQLSSDQRYIRFRDWIRHGPHTLPAPDIHDPDNAHHIPRPGPPNQSDRPPSGRPGEGPGRVRPRGLGEGSVHDYETMY
uniref:Uncharacterized protein n=1 Tax=Amorphochlora amoebiformis TaxID=1561963 RepID=A0A7S0D4F7_9EUKA